MACVYVYIKHRFVLYHIILYVILCRYVYVYMYIHVSYYVSTHAHAHRTKSCQPQLALNEVLFFPNMIDRADHE